MKHCAKCKQELPLDAFSPSKQGKRGSCCRICANAAAAAWRVANSERYRQQQAARRQAESNLQRQRQYAAAWYAANKDRIRQQRAASRAANPERDRQRNAAWYAAHPEQNRQHNAAYRARKRGATIGTVSHATILRRDGWVCHICGDFISPDELTFDHVVPLAKRGPHSNDNISPAHHRCNSAKRDRTDVPSAAPPRIKQRKV